MTGCGCGEAFIDSQSTRHTGDVLHTFSSSHLFAVCCPNRSPLPKWLQTCLDSPTTLEANNLDQLLPCLCLLVKSPCEDAESTQITLNKLYRSILNLSTLAKSLSPCTHSPRNEDPAVGGIVPQPASASVLECPPSHPAHTRQMSPLLRPSHSPVFPFSCMLPMVPVFLICQLGPVTSDHTGRV